MEIRYKRFFAEVRPSGNQFEVRIYTDIAQKSLLEYFSITIGQELLTGDDSDIEQFVKDYIDSEIKALRKLADETEVSK